MRAMLLAVAVVACAVGSVACSALMDSLSEDHELARPGAVATGSGDGGPDDTQSNSQLSSEMRDAEDAGVVVDEKLDNGLDAGVPLATACTLVTLTPSTAQNVGGNQPWNNPSNALVDDGNNAVTNLSLDHRDSAELHVGGFTGTFPANATVKGLLVDVDRSSGSTCIHLSSLVAVIAGAPRERPERDVWAGVRFYGGLEDLWGAPSIAPADLASPGFILKIKTRFVGNQQQCPPRSREARLDTVRVRAHVCTN